MSEELRISMEMLSEPTDVLIVRFAGYVSIMTMADTGYRAMPGTLPPGVKHLVFDLSGLVYSNLLFSHFLRAGTSLVSQRNGILLLCAVHPDIADFLAYEGVEQSYPAVSSISEAVSVIGNPELLERVSAHTWRMLKEPIYELRRERLTAFARATDLEKPSGRPQRKLTRYTIVVQEPPAGGNDAVVRLSGELVPDDIDAFASHMRWLASFGPSSIGILFSDVDLFDLSFAMAIANAASMLEKKSIGLTVRDADPGSGPLSTDGDIRGILAHYAES